MNLGGGYHHYQATTTGIGPVSGSFVFREDGHNEAETVSDPFVPYPTHHSGQRVVQLHSGKHLILLGE